MNMTIEQALGDRYLMFYHAEWPVHQLQPGFTLSQCVDQVNHFLKSHSRKISNWPDSNEVARLIWVNWIYQRFDIEPIRKPILTHKINHTLLVDCGDTRLMSLNLLEHPGHVGVLCTVTIDKAGEFDQWTPIRNNSDMLRAIDFDPQAYVTLRPAKTHAIEWMEIGDRTTEHHLHDVDQRIAMIQRYIDAQPENFEFTVNWAKTAINWDIYSR